MLIHGYDEQKTLMQIDLSVRTITEKQIDPWRVDLFDPDPIVLEKNGRRIFLTKLTDAAFAYLESDAKMVVGIDNGVDRICLVSEQYDSSSSHVELRNFRVSDQDFSHHFQSYLATGLKAESWLRKGNHKFFSCERAKCATLRAGFLHLDAQFGVLGPRAFHGAAVKHPVAFRGEMFKETALSFALPDQVNWVLETLGELHPAVVCRGLWHPLKGVPIGSVDLLINGDQSSSASHLLFNTPGASWRGSSHRGDRSWDQYVLNGCEYNLAQKKAGETVLDYFTDDKANTWSVQGVYSTKPNEIRGTRMAFHDLGRDATIPLSAKAQDWVEKYKSGADPLQLYFDFDDCTPCPASYARDGAQVVKFTALTPRKKRFEFPWSRPGGGTVKPPENDQDWYHKWCQWLGRSRSFAA